MHGRQLIAQGDKELASAMFVPPPGLLIRQVGKMRQLGSDREPTAPPAVP
jgi:hypothetical protein